MQEAQGPDLRGMGRRAARRGLPGRVARAAGLRLWGADDPQAAVRRCALRRASDPVAGPDARRRASGPPRIPHGGGMHRLVHSVPFDLPDPRGSQGTGLQASACGGDDAADRARRVPLRHQRGGAVHRASHAHEGQEHGSANSRADADDHDRQGRGVRACHAVFRAALRRAGGTGPSSPRRAGADARDRAQRERREPRVSVSDALQGHQGRWSAPRAVPEGTNAHADD